MATQPAVHAWPHARTNTRPSPRLTQTAFAVLLTLGASIALPAPARAQTASSSVQDAAKPFQVAGGNLSDALIAFAADAGVTVSAAPELIRGKTTGGVQGRHAVTAALQRLLAGTGLQAHAVSDGSFVLRAASGGTSGAPLPVSREVTLGSVTVTAAADGGVTEGTGSYTQTGPSGTATGLALTLRETPQSVTVMTRQRMEDFKLETLADVLDQTPGVAIDRQGDANNILIRGSSANLQVDGMRLLSSGWQTDSQKLYSMDDLVEYDRVEVLKGSSGLINGDGAYGGTINLVRKKPTADFKAHVTAGAGSWNNYRASGDVSGALNDGKTLRGRLVVAAADGEGFRDGVKHNNKTFYGVVEADVTPDTVVSAGLSWRERDYYGAGDTSMIQAYTASGQYLGLQPRSFNVGAPWSGYKQTSRTLFGSIEQKLGGGWKLSLRGSSEQTRTPGEMGIWWTVNPQAIDVAQTRSYENRNRSFALDVKGPVELFGRTHELLAGVDAQRATSEKFSASSRLSNLGLDYADGGGAIVRPDLDSLAVGNHSRFSSDRRSVYAAGHFSLADPVKLIGGARVTNYRQYDVTPYAWSNYDLKENGVLTPYGGLVIDVHRNVSIYGSYASIFNVQSSRDAQGRTLDPEEGVTYELGTKGEFLDGRLNASLAHFWMKTRNTAEATGDSFSDGTAIYRAVSEATRRGYELELSGQLTPSWQLQGSYVVNDSSLTSASTSPRKQFKLASTYRLDGMLSGLTLGAATRWQSSALSLIHI